MTNEVKRKYNGRLGMQHMTKGSLAINEETLQHHHCQHNGQEEDLNKEKNARVNRRDNENKLQKIEKANKKKIPRKDHSEYALTYFVVK